MSVRRPGRRYIGFRYRPGTASRRDVARALDEVWAASGAPAAGAKPRLLVCESGAGILVVPTPGGAALRRAMARAGPAGPAAGRVAVDPVVTSGTIATVKEAMGLPRRRQRR